MHAHLQYINEVTILVDRVKYLHVSSLTGTIIKQCLLPSVQSVSAANLLQNIKTVKSTVTV